MTYSIKKGKFNQTISDGHQFHKYQQNEHSNNQLSS